MMFICPEVKLTLTNAPPSPTSRQANQSNPPHSTSGGRHHNINIRSPSRNALYQLMSPWKVLRFARAINRVQHSAHNRKMSSNFKQRSVVSSFICTSPQSPGGLKFALFKRSQDVSTYRYSPPPAPPFRTLTPPSIPISLASRKPS